MYVGTYICTLLLTELRGRHLIIVSYNKNKKMGDQDNFTYQVPEPGTTAP